MAGFTLAVVMAVLGMFIAFVGYAMLSVYPYNILGWALMLLAALSFFVATVAWFNRKEI